MTPKMLEITPEKETRGSSLPRRSGSSPESDKSPVHTPQTTPELWKKEFWLDLEKNRTLEVVGGD